MPFSSNITPGCHKAKSHGLLGDLISLAELRAFQSEEYKTVCSSNSRSLREAQGVQSAKSQIVGFLKPRFHCTTCSPHQWGSPLRGPLKGSKNVPDVFVAWECPSRAIFRQDDINAKSPVVLGALISLAELGIAQSEERNIGCSPNSRPLRRAQCVQSAKSQIVGFLKPRFHCTTLQVLHRQKRSK